MSADARVVPVGHENGSVRCDANICRTKPIVASTLQQVLDASLVARAVGSCRVSANNVGASVTVQYLIPENLGQQTSFVDGDARRRTGTRL